MGLAQSLFLRAYRICSPEYLDDEINHIFQTLNKLAYPNEILKKNLILSKENFLQTKNQKCNKIKQKKCYCPLCSIIRKTEIPPQKT